MATLKQIKSTAESVGVALNTKTLNFLHKHQEIQPTELADAYLQWFSVELDAATRTELELVLRNLIPGWGQQIEDELEPSDAESSDEVETTEPEGDELDESEAVDLDVEFSDASASGSEEIEAGLDQEPLGVEEAAEAAPIVVSEPEPKPVEPFRPWWDESTAEAETQAQLEGVAKTPKPDVSAFLNVVRRPETDRFEYVAVASSGAELELSWEPSEGSPTYVVCGEVDHYPFEVTIENALAISSEPHVSISCDEQFFTVFVFSSASSKGVPWAKGRRVSEVEWFSADVVDGKVALRWAAINEDLELRLARSLPDAELAEKPTANFWLPITAKSDSFVDSNVELGKTYEYRAYLEWLAPDGVIHSTTGVSQKIKVVVDFPKVLSFSAHLDGNVSGLVACEVEGVNNTDFVEIFEVDGLPSEELLAAISERRQLRVQELTLLATRHWLGQSLVGTAESVPSGVRFTTVLSNAGKTSKTFVLVLTVGDVAQVTQLATIQRVGEILSATLIERYDYQLIRVDQPTGAHSLDVWVVAAAVPFSQIAHTPPTRRVLIQEEYLRYGGILFADSVPDKPQIRKLAPNPQTIYVRGASTFEGQTEFGSVVQVSYPGRIELTYRIEEPKPEAEAQKEPAPKKRLFGKKKPQQPALAQPAPTKELTTTERERPTNKRIDALGKSLLTESQYEPKKQGQLETALKKIVDLLTGKRRKKKVQAQPDGKRAVFKITGYDPGHHLKSVAALHFASNTLPLDEHDCTVSKVPLDFTIAEFKNGFKPYRVSQDSTVQPVHLRLESGLQHRFQLQAGIADDLLKGVKCFSIDGSVDAEMGKTAPAVANDQKLSIVVIGPSGSGKSTYLAALTHYLQEQYEHLVKAELIEDEASENRLRMAAESLSTAGSLPKQGRPITGSKDSAASLLKFVSKSPVPIRELSVVDASGLNIGDPEVLKLASEYLLKADLILVMIDPTQNPTVSELASGIVSKTAANSEQDEPFWLMQTIVGFLNDHAQAKNPNQKVGICLTKADALEVASAIPGTSLYGTIRSGMALARDPHMLWRGDYLESYGSLLDKEVRSLLARVSGFGAFMKFVDDSFTKSEVRYFAVSSLGRSNFSATLGGGGLTPIRVSDPIRWVASSKQPAQPPTTPDPAIKAEVAQATN